MTWLISDANVIIDMEVGGILDLMFSLPETFGVPDVLYADELATQHSHLIGLGLRTLEINPEFVTEAVRLAGVYRKPGYMDLLALALAKQEQCPLLTGDANLRAAAEAERVDVRGTLWIVGRLHSEQLIDASGVDEAYKKMKANGRRLPWEEIEQQLRRMRAY